MDHSLAVRGIEGAGDLDGDAEGFFDRQRSLAEARFEAFALDVLHDEEFDRTLAADVVERADVGVIQAGDGSRFAFEALGDSALTDFDGNGTVQARVAGFVDFAHSPCAQQGDDLVRPEAGLLGQEHRPAMIHDGPSRNATRHPPQKHHS